MLSYTVLKFLHLLGVVLLVGNVTVTAVWKVFADRSENPDVVAFAQRLVTITDFSFTGSGIVLIMGGGYGASMVAGLQPFAARWLVLGQGLFLVSGAIWACILIPLQIRQARMARAFVSGGTVPTEYRIAASRWLVWGIVATVPLVAAIWVMIEKPLL